MPAGITTERPARRGRIASLSDAPRSRRTSWTVPARRSFHRAQGGQIRFPAMMASAQDWLPVVVQLADTNQCVTSALWGWAQRGSRKKMTAQAFRDAGSDLLISPKSTLRATFKVFSASSRPVFSVVTSERSPKNSLWEFTSVMRSALPCASRGRPMQSNVGGRPREPLDTKAGEFRENL